MTSQSQPHILWRCAKRCELVRTVLKPDGWHIVGKDFRQRPQEWLRAIGVATEEGEQILRDGVEISLEARDRGDVAIPNLRTTRGFRAVLPIQPSAWPNHEGFQLGCRHGTATGRLDWLQKDVQMARNTPSREWPVRRSVLVT